MIREWLAVALGGLFGTLLRHSTAHLFSLSGAYGLPMATLFVNIIGCLAIGFVAQWSAQNQCEHSWWVIGVKSGLLGGLTTFSSFGLDVVRLWQLARPEAACGLAILHAGLGIGAVILGMKLAVRNADLAA